MSAPRVRVPLTPRQREVARLVGMGYTYNRIGAMLSPRVTIRTVQALVLAIDARITWPDDAPASPRQRVHEWARASLPSLRDTG